jgi:hypothetical protein
VSVARSLFFHWPRRRDCQSAMHAQFQDRRRRGVCPARLAPCVKHFRLLSMRLTQLGCLVPPGAALPSALALRGAPEGQPRQAPFACKILQGVECEAGPATLKRTSITMTPERCIFAKPFNHLDTREKQLCDTVTLMTPGRRNFAPRMRHHDSTEVQLCDTHPSSGHQRGSTLRRALTALQLCDMYGPP